ncbi:MAG: hypothetical protein IJE43_23340 [Alphaproteobacteria bacterium]|nr:hypothetical protein [Alphaproteobacteria bacterium]
MDYKEEFLTREDVLRVRCQSTTTSKGALIFFVPNDEEQYEFCVLDNARNSSKDSDEYKIQEWMDNVNHKSVYLEAIPYVIRDSHKKSLGINFKLSDKLYYKKRITDFANVNGIEIKDTIAFQKQGKIQVLGLGVEKYIETFDYYNDKIKDEAERYKIFAIDVMNGKKYIINLSEERGMCGSGYCSSTYGKMKVEEYKKGSAFTHKPKGVIYIENLQIDPKTLDVKAPLNNNYTDDSGTVTIHNNIFKFSNYGGDRYYPGGYVEINMDNFEQLPRAMEKRPVWIIKGASGTGKTTLASHIQGLSVFETDSVTELPETIYDDVVVLGNRSGFTVDDVKERLYGDPAIMEVSFDRKDREYENERGIKNSQIDNRGMEF